MTIAFSMSRRCRISTSNFLNCQVQYWNSEMSLMEFIVENKHFKVNHNWQCTCNVSPYFCSSSAGKSHWYTYAHWCRKEKGRLRWSFEFNRLCCMLSEISTGKQPNSSKLLIRVTFQIKKLIASRVTRFYSKVALICTWIYSSKLFSIPLYEA